MIKFYTWRSIMKDNVMFLLAAGSSTRVENLETKKQFYRDSIYKKPVFLYPLLTSLKTDLFKKVYLVIAKEDMKMVQNILEEFSVRDEKLVLVEGGTSRPHSVLNAIKKVEADKFNPENTNVVIHDACRPFVSVEDFEKLIEKLKEKESVSYAISVVDTLIEKYPFPKAVDRDNFKRIQTPQAFHLSTLIKAYQVTSNFSNTDEMQIVSKITKDFTTIPGKLRLFKITYDEDIELLEILLKGYYELHNK